jgi:hypothetical protein
VKDHVPKVRRAMHVGAGLIRREVEHDYSLTETEDGEDRRQRRRSVRADAVRILWRGNTWRMPKGCVLRHAMARG